MQDDNGLIREMLEEAENEKNASNDFYRNSTTINLRKIFNLSCPNRIWNFYTFLYIFFNRTAHRMIGYFEEEAVISYTEYLDEIDKGQIENTQAPEIAINYWNLSKDATLRDVVIAVRNDEAAS